MLGRYRPADALADADLDAVIVTGAEPRTPDLDAEPYWPELARLIDWTAAEGVPAIWSCLAAHAAALRLAGVRRRRLPAKLSGVFTARRMSRHPLLAYASANLRAPHSRLNELAADALERAGLPVLSWSNEAGVDAFVRPGPAPMLFLQGHPEYEADTLLREYARDLGRFERGERATRPDLPANYVAPAAAARLAAGGDAQPANTWRNSAVALYRGWLGLIPHTAAPARILERAVSA
jgi:homoserine O-succinyltransferase